MPDLPPIQCINDMVAAMGETMTEAQARAMMNKAVERTKAKVAAENIPEWAAAAAVVKEMKQEQKLAKALGKRQATMDMASQLRLQDIAETGQSTFGKNIRKFLQKVEDIGNRIGSRHVASFFADLQERQVLDGWLNKKLALPIMQELEQLNFQRLGLEHKVGFTENKQAQAIAEVFFKRRLDIQAQNNRWGAHTEEVPGYMFLQTHSADRLKRAGKHNKFFSKEDINESYKAWRESLDGLNIDWGRTLAGEDHEAFLRGFHDAVYTNVHGEPIEQGPLLRKFQRPGGSLADKLSTQRVLWFADAASAHRYNEMWGTADVQASMLNTLRMGGRNTAMLMNLGPRPVDNVIKVRDELLPKTKEKANAQAQVESLLDRGNIEGQMDLLTGAANISVRPWLSHTVDVIKSFTLATKGGSIILSAFGDKAFLQSRMAYEGFTAAEMVAGHLLALMRKNPRLAAEVGVYNASVAGAHVNRWTQDLKPVAGLNWVLNNTMKLQGMNAWTYANQAAMGMLVARKLGEDAHLPWDKLSERRRAILTEYGFSPKEWDVIRSTAYKFDEDNLVITPDKMRELPNDAVASMLGHEPLKKATTVGVKEVDDLLEQHFPTQSKLERAKDELAAKLDFYIGDAVNEAVPTPDAAVRSIRTWRGTQRGEWSREMAELVMIFKGFPIKALMTANHQRQGIGGLGGTFHALTLVAQAGALGYLSGVAKDFIRGRTPKRLIEDDGTINAKVWIDALQRGGGLGIFGDLLFSDYDKRIRSGLSSLGGPVASEVENALSLFSRTRKVAEGEDKAEGVGYEAFKMVENNLPLVGMFPVKPVMEYLVMWQLREALSPGVWRRTQRATENFNYQEYWVEPVR